MSELINFYEHPYVKKYVTEYNNPNYEKTYMKHPFYAGMIGPSGAGKTNALMNLIILMSQNGGTWTHIHVVYKEMENLYRGLEDMCLTVIDGKKRDKLEKVDKKVKPNDKQKDMKKKGIHGNQLITFYNDLDLLPEPENIKQDGQQLVIFDDQISEGPKKQNIIMTWYIRGRKCKNHGFSCVILSQSYFEIPKTIRSQFHHLFLIKISDKRDLKLILSTIGKSDVDMNLLTEMFDNATEKLGDCLKINIINPDINKSFSRNFINFYLIK